MKQRECAFCYYARYFMVGVIGIAIAWLIQSEWFQAACQGGCEQAVGILVWPAMWIAKAFSGKGEIVSTYFATGMLFQTWLIYLWVDALFLRKKQ